MLADTDKELVLTEYPIAKEVDCKEDGDKEKPYRMVICIAHGRR
jgi:hypothetical protein